MSPANEQLQQQQQQALDAATIDRLQEQLLGDDEFADDMRALLLARFRARHRSKVDDAAAVGADGGSDASDERSSIGAADVSNSDVSPEDVRMLEKLGYELQANERVLSKGSVRSPHAAEPPLCDQHGLLLKLEELRYTPPPGLRRVPFVETLAVVADVGAATEAADDSASRVDVADDLKREAALSADYTPPCRLPPLSVSMRVPTVSVAVCSFVVFFHLSCLLKPFLYVPAHFITNHWAYVVSTYGFSRPPDFLAEMLKSDQQMGRIRARIDAEQEQQRQFEAKRNQRLNKKFNKLSGHHVVREQEEARLRNMQLQAIDQWKKDRQTAVRAGTAVGEAEDEFDQWLIGNESKQNKITPNHGHSFKLKGPAGRKPQHAGAHKPHRRKGKNAKLKGSASGKVGRGKTGQNRRKRGH
ncbi:hypothetical protein Emag_003912 [Eimeria magna]